MDGIETKIFVGQKAFINQGGKVLVLRDPNYVTDKQQGLDFPGGRFRWPGNPKDELIREVKEETGLEIDIGKPFYVWTNYDHHKTVDPNRIFLIGYLCKYKSGNVVLSNEHDKFEWVDDKTYIKWDEPGSYFKALEYYFKVWTREGSNL